jgi:1-deoxy-D-xylulose 5-phosphate reductoisomerase
MTGFAPIARTNVYPKAEFTASDLKRGGSVLEAANEGKVVRIMRRDTGFLLIREDHVMTLVAELLDTTPRSLEQMLEGFTAEDAASLRERMTAWRADQPVGHERL